MTDKVSVIHRYIVYIFLLILSSHFPSREVMVKGQSAAEVEKSSDSTLSPVVF